MPSAWRDPRLMLIPPSFAARPSSCTTHRRLVAFPFPSRKSQWLTPPSLSVTHAPWPEGVRSKCVTSMFSSGSEKSSVDFRLWKSRCLSEQSYDVEYSYVHHQRDRVWRGRLTPDPLMGSTFIQVILLRACAWIRQTRPSTPSPSTSLTPFVSSSLLTCSAGSPNASHLPQT